MFSRRFRARSLAAAVLLLAAPAWADDESAGVTPGLFRAQPTGSVVLASNRIVLDGDQINIALGITARRGATVGIHLPRFAWLGEAETYPDRHFPEVTVDVDGRAVMVKDDVSPTFEGRTITRSLRQAGLDPFAVARTPPFVSATPGRQAPFNALVASGAV